MGASGGKWKLPERRRRRRARATEINGEERRIQEDIDSEILDQEGPVITRSPGASPQTYARIGGVDVPRWEARVFGPGDIPGVDRSAGSA
jgi:hypothetical protein